MKKLLISLVVVLFSATVFASAHGDFVQTSEGTFYFKKVKQGVKCCLIGVKENGEKVKFNKNEVISFSKGGQQYEKMPVFKSNKPTGEEDFMAVVSYRNGMKLYKYEYISKTSHTPARRYYVFKGKDLVVEMDYMNKPSLTAFFSGK